MFAARVRSPRKIVEEPVVEVKQRSIHAEVPLIIEEDWSEGTVLSLFVAVFFLSAF